jgi:acetyl esterase/lipase
MLGVTGGISYFDDLALGAVVQPSNAQAVIAWSAPINFTKMDAQLIESGLGPKRGEEHNGKNSPESLLMGTKISFIPDEVRIANPENYVRPGLPPILLQHGKQDDVVPYQQSLLFAERLMKVLRPEVLSLDLIEGAGHLDPQLCSAENLERVFRFLDRHLNECISE